ncbi:hypothetical protein VTL71DRAFT_10445 [Oculimacula yallundae]|uniref:Uncharacterized protein n=1 Tax=Oculimacula yallundae TaxID=86028 RepID=A0ABR4CT42_9HELO
MLLLPLTLVFSSFVTATVLPTQSDTRDEPLHGAVIMCSDFNWKGECISIAVPLAYNSCTSLKAPWAYNVSSLEPVPGTVCWLHNSTNCGDICMSPSGCSKIVEFPGYANLSTYGYPAWTGRIGSFTCSPTKTFYD